MLQPRHHQFDATDETSFSAERGTNADEHLRGHHGDDHIKARGGNDVVGGRRGDDTLDGGSGDDKLVGDQGRDHLRGGTGDDIARGGLGRDHLSGGAGDDILFGGRGADRLTGGAGADEFRVAGDGRMDRVTDFDFAEGDRINAVGFKLLGLHVDAGLGVTTAMFDRNNDGVADARIRVNGILTADGIILGRQPGHQHHDVDPASAFGDDRIAAAGTGGMVESHHHVGLETAHLAVV